MMPKMSGIEVLKIIKQKSNLKNIPVIVLTNLSSVTDAEEAIKQGAIKFIVKSKNKPKDIVREVREIISASSRDDVPTIN